MVNASPPLRPSHPVSLADVARRAGVGLTTASYALRSHPKIPQVTRLRVQAAADALGYRINATVGRLMAELRIERPASGLTTLAWINCNTSADAYSTLPWLRGWLTGARLRADQLGYGLEEFWMGDPEVTTARVHQILRTRAIPGVLIAPTRATNGIFSLDCSSFSVAAMARTFRQPQFHQAAADDFANTNIVFKELGELGYRRIGFFSSPLICEWSDQRQLGAFLQSSLGVPIAHRVPPLIVPEDSSEGMAAFRKWFRRWKPDALISPSKIQYEWLAEMNIEVPRDCGYAHLNLGSDVAGWAGIDSQTEWIAAGAVDMLVGQIHRHETGPPSRPKEMLLKGVWVQGNTVRRQS